MHLQHKFGFAKARAGLYVSQNMVMWLDNCWYGPCAMYVPEDASQSPGTCSHPQEIQLRDPGGPLLDPPGHPSRAGRPPLPLSLQTAAPAAAAAEGGAARLPLPLLLPAVKA